MHNVRKWTKKIEGYWRLIEPVWEQIDIYSCADAFLQNYRAVRRGAGLVYAAHFAQYEICNGGFPQFFSNSTGVLAPEAKEGFQEIGMDKTAEIVSTAMALLGKSYPR
ncbi:MAG TPA: DUF4375 domain-containing protein [Bryobacteraceae bacterium]|nr:DUF4375 domain-containing protein [Bryobacteraceae bacterium]